MNTSLITIRADQVRDTKVSEEWNIGKQGRFDRRTSRVGGTSNEIPDSQDPLSNNGHCLTVVKGSQQNLHDSENDASDAPIFSLKEKDEAIKTGVLTKAGEMSDSRYRSVTLEKLPVGETWLTFVTII